MGRHLAPFRGLTQDIRIGFRQLRATPVVTAVAILSLALGIGANTALFSLANSLLLRPLPVNEPDRLVMISDTATPGSRCWDVPGLATPSATGRTVRGHLRMGADTVDAFGRHRGAADHGRLGQRLVFRDARRGAALGRVLTDADDRPGGGTDGPVMVISDAFWQRRFQRDPAAIGRQFILNGVPVSIVGVTPRDSWGPISALPFDVLLPIADEPSLNRGDSLLNGGVLGVVMLARLKAGQTSEAATAALRAVQPEIREAARPASRAARARTHTPETT